MTDKKDIKKKKNKYYNVHRLLLIALFISTLFMSIGYAGLNAVTLDVAVTATAKAPTGLFIRSVEIVDATNGANILDSSVTDFNNTMVNSTTVLSQTNKDSTVTYKITVYNGTTDELQFDNVKYQIGQNTYSNENIDYILTGLSQGSIIQPKESVEFNITFKYTDTYKLTSAPYNNTLKSYINYNFTNQGEYSVAYVGLDDTTSLPKSVEQNSTLQVDFSGYKINITGVTIDGVSLPNTSYSFINNILSIPNVSGNVIVITESIQDMDFVISEGQTEISTDKITPDNPVTMADLINIPTEGMNFNNKLITSIRVEYEYTATTGITQSIITTLKTNGKTLEKTVNFARTNNGTVGKISVEFGAGTDAPLNIGLYDTFTITNRVSKQTNGKVNILGQKIYITFEE